MTAKLRSFVGSLLGVLAVVGGLVLAAGAAWAADPGVLVRSGDRITAAIAEAADVDAFDFDLLEGGSLRVDVAAAGRSALRPSLRLFRPDGAEFDLLPHSHGGGTKHVGIRTFRVPEPVSRN